MSVKYNKSVRKIKHRNIYLFKRRNTAIGKIIFFLYRIDYKSWIAWGRPSTIKERQTHVWRLAQIADTGVIRFLVRGNYNSYREKREDEGLQTVVKDLLLTSLSNNWGLIAKMAACSSGTLTNVLPHRNAKPQIQDMTPLPITQLVTLVITLCQLSSSLLCSPELLTFLK